MAIGTQYFITKDGRKAYTANGVAYDAVTGQQLWLNNKTEDPNDTMVYKEGFGLDSRGYAVPHSDAPSVDPPAAATGSSVGPAAPTTRTNGNGVSQTGRNFSGSLSFGDAVAYLQRSTGGYVQGFGKNWNTGQLPTTNSNNPFTGSTSESPQFNAGAPAILDQNSSSYMTNGGMRAASNTSGKGTPTFTGKEERTVAPTFSNTGNDTETVDLGGGNLYQADKNGRIIGVGDGSLSAALADKQSLKFDSSKYKASEGFKPADYATSSDEVARRRAMLDAPDTITGMKAVKALNNFVSVGGGDFYNNNGNLIRVDGQDMRDRLNDRMSAQQFKDKYVKDLTGPKPETPSSAQNPPTPQISQNDDEINPNSANIPGRKYGPGGLWQ